MKGEKLFLLSIRGTDPLKTESTQEINYHKEEIKMIGRSPMGSAMKQKKEGRTVYEQWIPEQMFPIIMEYFAERKSVADICRKRSSRHNCFPSLETP